MTESASRDAALLLMDLQRGIVANYADADYLARIQRAVAAARRANIRVIWVRVAFRAGYPEVSEDHRMFASLRATGRFIETEPDTALHPDLDVQPHDVIVTKRRVGAFSGSDLDAVLRGGGIRHLVLAGLSTSGVVLSTVRFAADLDYRLTVLSDGCLDAHADVHRVLTEKVFPRQAEVLSIDAWSGALARAS